MSIRKASKRASTESSGSRNDPLKLPNYDSISDPRVRLVIDFLHGNFQTEVTLNDLARHTNLSASYFWFLFKSETGLSPGEYLRRIRMQKARELLATSVLSIKQVMTKSGYKSKNNFTRHFDRYFGATPSEYKRRSRQMRGPNATTIRSDTK